MRMITRSNPARRGAAVPAYFLERAHFSSPISVLLRVEIAASLSPQEELVRERRGRTRYTTDKKASYVSLGDRRRVEHLTKMITWKKKNGLQKMLSLLGGVGGSRFGNDEWSQSSRVPSDETEVAERLDRPSWTLARPGAGRPAESTTNGALQCSEDSPNLEERDSDGVPNVGQLEGGLREAAGRGQIYHCLK